MRKFKVGDKIVCIETNTEELRANDLKHGKLYFVTDRDSLGVYVSDNSENCTYACDFRFKLAEEKDMEQTAEQIRDEILRIDARIEEAKKDIENAESGRNSLVEKLREKGFELIEESASQTPLEIGDTVKVVGYSETHHEYSYIGYVGTVHNTDNTERPYEVYLEKTGDTQWFTTDEVKKI